MKFIRNNELDQYLQSLLDVNELNLSISDIFSSILGNRDIFNKKEIETLEKSSDHSNREIVLSKLVDYLDIDMDVEDNEEIFNRYILSCIYKVDMDKYLSNPYYLKFKDLSFKENNYELVIDKYLPYELFAYQDMGLFPESYIEKNSLGYSDNEYQFLALNDHDVTWMSITPNEIETMEKSLELVKGKVAVFGLGLGYFAYMASLKSEVNEITIIENNPQIIALFKKHILPRFEHQEKITIIEADALSYIKMPIKADYAFVDLWHNPFDGLELFLKFKKIENKNANCHFLYWLESSFYLLLRRCMLTLIGEQLENTKESNYLHAENYLDKVINKYYLKTKNLTISSKAQLDDLLSDESLVYLLLND